MTSILDAIETDNSRILELIVSIPSIVPRKHIEQGLLAASKRGASACLEILLDALKPDLCLLDTRTNSTPLNLAAEAGHHDIVRILLHNGVDVNERTGNRWTPLHYASNRGHDRCVVELAANGADINARDSCKNTPLLLASKNCHLTFSVIKTLSNDVRCDLNAQNSDMRTALHYTCSKAVGSEVLLAAGASPDFQDSEGNSPLIIAAIEGFDAVVKCLVSYGCNPDLQNIHGKTALHYLAMKNHWQGIDAIAKIGGDVNVADKRGLTPLWYSVNHNRPDAVKALLRANCKTDIVLVDGLQSKSPLQIALESRLFELAKCLVLAGNQLGPLYDWMARQMQSLTDQSEDAADALVDPIAEEVKSAVEWFSNWIHTPHSLQQLCRITTRRHLGRNIGGLRKQGSLPLPKFLIDYLILKEVEDHHIVGFIR